MINLLRVLILLTLFLTPLLGPGQLGFEQTKVVFFIIMTSLSGLLWLYLISQDKLKIKWDKLNIACLVFILWLLVSSLFGVDPRVSLLGAQPYLQGWLTYLYLYLFFLIVRSVKVYFEQLVTVLSLSAFLVAAVAIKEWMIINLFHGYVPTYGGRIVSTFGQPNLYSGFILLTIPLQYFLLKNSKNLKQKAIFLGLILSILAILISQSRTAIFILGILLIIPFIKKIKALIVVLAVVTVAVTIWLIRSELLISQDNIWLNYNSPEKRVFIWPILWGQFLERPLIGYGLENIPTAYSGFFGKVNFNTLNSPSYHGLKNLKIDRAHNYILDLSLFSGIIGVLFWLAIFYLIFRKTKNTTLKICLLTYLIWIQFQPQGIVQLIYFWLLTATSEGNF